MAGITVTRRGIADTAARNRALRDFVSVYDDYGVTGNGSTDDTASLLAATNDARNRGKLLYVPKGTYKSSDVITDVSNVNPLIIEGEDPDTSVFTMTSGTWLNGLINLSATGIGTAKVFSAPTVAGANVITISSTSGMAAGNAIYIVDTTQVIVGSSGRTTASLFGEFARIKSVDSGTQLTLKQKLDLPYTTSATAAKYVGQALSARGLGFRNLNPGTLPATARPLGITNFRDLDLAHLAFQDMDADCIYGQIGFDATISDIRFLDTHDLETANNPYCIALAKAVSQTLVEHVRSRYGRHLITTLPASNYAAPAYIKIADSIATEHTESAFDCHPGTRRMTFENCEAHGAGTGGGSPNGFQIRGPDCDVLNCKATGQGLAGVSVIFGADRCRIVGGRYANCDTGVAIESSDDCFIGGDVLLESPVTNGINVVRDAAYSANMSRLALGDVLITGSPTNLINDTTAGAVAILKGGRIRTPGASAVLAGGSLDAWWNPTRGSNVSAFPSRLANAALTMTSGTAFSVRAVVRETGAYTQLQFLLGSTAPGGTYTDCRVGVQNVSGTSILADSGNVQASVSGSSKIVVVALGTTLNLIAGQVVALVVGFIASTAPTVRGITAPTGGEALNPIPAGATVGWTTGTALPLVGGGGNTSSVIWAELLA